MVWVVMTNKDECDIIISIHKTKEGAEKVLINNETRFCWIVDYELED